MWIEKLLKKARKISCQPFAIAWEDVCTGIHTCCWRSRDVEKHDHRRQPPKRLMVMLHASRARPAGSTHVVISTPPLVYPGWTPGSRSQAGLFCPLPPRSRAPSSRWRSPDGQGKPSVYGVPGPEAGEAQWRSPVRENYLFFIVIYENVGNNFLFSYLFKKHFSDISFTGRCNNTSFCWLFIIFQTIIYSVFLLLCCWRLFTS